MRLASLGGYGEILPLRWRIARHRHTDRRAYTKQTKVASAGYHGWHDWYLGRPNLRRAIFWKGICFRGSNPAESRPALSGHGIAVPDNQIS